MRAVTAAALAHVLPDVVLLDLSALDCRRGDGLLGILPLIDDADREHPVGIVVVAGEACIDAARSLAGGGAEDPPWLFADIEAAWPRVRALALARSRAIG